MKQEEIEGATEILVEALYEYDLLWAIYGDTDHDTGEKARIPEWTIRARAILEDAVKPLPGGSTE